MKLVQSHLNIYSNDGNWITHPSDYDCLYANTNDLLSTVITNIPYCLRSNTFEDNFNRKGRCHGETLTFQMLKSLNITEIELLRWNAAISTVDRYSKYLFSNQQMDDFQFYCKCSSSLNFGELCQYEFDQIDFIRDEINLNELLANRKDFIRQRTNDEVTLESITCYVGIRCQTSLLCLDWRQICNGMVDCDYAEDEPFELCSQLEFHQCNSETEFRCKNGLCIPISLSDDHQFDCLDQSDKEIPLLTTTRTKKPSCSPYDDLYCEDVACLWKEYSCGDSQCLSYGNAGAGNEENGETCFNQRNILLLKQLFYTKHQDECWKIMICFVGYSHIYSNIDCSNRITIEDIIETCPDQFYFPPNPMIYSFVYFLYEKRNRLESRHYTGPNFICYHQTFCKIQLSISAKLFNNSLLCLPMNSTTFSWKTFYDYVIFLFSPCFTSFNASLISTNNKMIYKCDQSNTFISIHRLKDRRYDCYFHEDEASNIDLCFIDIPDRFTCLKNRNECIRQSFVRDFIYDCSDETDEYFAHSHMVCERKTCQRYFQRYTEPSSCYPIEKICDGIIDRKFFFDNDQETDETDCEYWPYTCENSPYTRCNHIWNCKNGIDELKCTTNSLLNIGMHDAFGCVIDEHYCIRFKANGNGIDLTCIHINRTADGIIDCLGATDERFSSICTTKYSNDYERRFLCMNSSICITPKQVCDTIIDCPFEDDERVCPWLYKTDATEFNCENVSTLQFHRCFQSILAMSHCKHREHFWFCDLVVTDINYIIVNSPPMELYPLVDRRTKRSISYNQWICHHGYPVKMLQDNGKVVCLCPPSYYGYYCQYQSERLTLFLKIQPMYYFNPLTIFRLLFFLFDDQQKMISHDELIYHQQYDSTKRFLVHLLYERIEKKSLFQLLKPKWIRIDSYIIELTHVRYVSSWLFTVLHPFLPINRLSAVLNLENEVFHVSKCRKKCGSNGKCLGYLNAKHLEYCWCHENWYGDKCQLQYSNQQLCHKNACAPHSRCIVLDSQKNLIKCICPLGKYGDECYIKNKACDKVVCQNNGTCLPLDERNFVSICICHEDFDGDFCEYRRNTMNVSIPTSLSTQNQLPVVIVIMASLLKSVIFQRRIFYTDVQAPGSVKAYGLVRYAFMQIFHNISYNSYHLIAIQKRSFSLLNTTIIPSNQCLNISNLFNETVLREYSYLKRLKLYHLPCYRNPFLRCFFDEYRLCLCSSDHKSVCYHFNHDRGNCNYCSNGGLCIQRDTLEYQWNFRCICPPCSSGSLCQFTMTQYFINMDMLIGTEIKQSHPSLKDQPLIIVLTLIVLVLIVLIGTVSNTISFIVLSSKYLQKVGCDSYLLHLTIVSQMGVMGLFLRFLYMLLSQTIYVENMELLHYSCLILEFLVRLISPLFDWFTVCISLERTYIVISNTHYTKVISARMIKMTRFIIIANYLFNIATTIHRPFHMILVGEPSLHSDRPRHPWCILHFNSNTWNTYEKFISIFHLVTPLSINLVSMISFLFYKVKLQFTMVTSDPQKTLYQVLKEQLSKYKPILISTVVVISLELPRCLLTFLYGCVELNWQRYLYLNFYLISFFPLTSILLIYIMPSPKYRQHLHIFLRKKCRIRCFIQNKTDIPS